MTKKKVKPLYYVFMVLGIFGAACLRALVRNDPNYGGFVGSAVGAAIIYPLGVLAGYFVYKFIFGNPVEEVDTDNQDNEKDNESKN